MNRNKPMKVSDLRKVLSFTKVPNTAEVRVEVEIDPLRGEVVAGEDINWRLQYAEYEVDPEDESEEGKFTLVLKVGEESD